MPMPLRPPARPPVCMLGWAHTVGANQISEALIRHSCGHCHLQGGASGQEKVLVGCISTACLSTNLVAWQLALCAASAVRFRRAPHLKGRGLPRIKASNHMAPQPQVDSRAARGRASGPPPGAGANRASKHTQPMAHCTRLAEITAT